MHEEHDLAIERILEAPRALVWRAWTSPELMRLWWAPRPYQTPECALELKPGGRFYTRMTGPDGFDTAGESCVLEVVEGERIVWSNALLPGWRPAGATEDCGGFPFTAVFTFEDSGEGRTLYRARTMHRNQAERDTHADMGFEQGWGICADQLGEVAMELAAKGC
jgi:uncharacterized protein YndB with AHSA1/START domain